MVEPPYVILCIDRDFSLYILIAKGDSSAEKPPEATELEAIFVAKVYLQKYMTRVVSSEGA